MQYYPKDEIDSKINNILTQTNLNFDTILGIHILINRIKGASKFLLEYLEANSVILDDDKIDYIDKGSIISNHIARIYEYLGEKCCFRVIYDYVENEVIPEFPKKKNSTNEPTFGCATKTFLY